MKSLNNTGDSFVEIKPQLEEASLPKYILNPHAHHFKLKIKMKFQVFKKIINIKNI